MTTLVVGIGNPWASDDGVGPEVVRRVQARWQEEGRDQMERSSSGPSRSPTWGCWILWQITML